LEEGGLTDTKHKKEGREVPPAIRPRLKRHLQHVKVQIPQTGGKTVEEKKKQTKVRLLERRRERKG